MLKLVRTSATTWTSSVKHCEIAEMIFNTSGQTTVNMSHTKHCEIVGIGLNRYRENMKTMNHHCKYENYESPV